MLREAWDYWRADCAAGARRIGLAAEAVALAARARRQRAAWQGHLERSRHHLLSAANASGPGTLVVLGSGSCLDVPVETLSARFERVLLADAVQLAAVRARVSRLHNVELRTLDLTGAIMPLLNCPRPIDDQSLDRLRFQPPDIISDIRDAACVASVNLLSQLPLAMAAWLQRQQQPPSLPAINRFSWRVIEEHVALLRSTSGQVVLIADACQRSTDPCGKVTDETRPLQPLGLDQRIIDRWEWPVAPRGERGDGETTMHEVVAIRW